MEARKQRWPEGRSASYGSGCLSNQKATEETCISTRQDVFVSFHD